MQQVMVFSAVCSTYIEQLLRGLYKSDQLLVAEKQCVAQFEADYSKAEGERHESEIAVTKAHTALKTRNQMTAFIFHEIRNPLNALLGAVQMIATTVKDEKGKRWSSMAMSTMGMVTTVLNDVLYLSKIEDGKVPLEIELFNLGTLPQGTLGLDAAQTRTIVYTCRRRTVFPYACIRDRHRRGGGRDRRRQQARALRRAHAAPCAAACPAQGGRSSETVHATAQGRRSARPLA